MASALDDLLGGPVPPTVAELPDDDLARLAELIEAARVRQAQQLDAAIRKSLSGVPLPVRGIVRKALLG